MALGTPQSAIISAIVFNALIIPLLVPLALRGVRYRPVGATALLRRNLLIYGARRPDRAVHRDQADRPRRPQCPGGVTGRHKVFLGMAAGVGKTYRMLQEGRAELEAGRDVVIGYLEPHGRVETEAQATGLPLLPAPAHARTRTCRSRRWTCRACSARKPELALIDELAHTNAPGLEHGKRYEDIADVLGAGIDVFSTVNVQHLESLNDQVAELTGVRVRETFPDSVLSDADEVVLVDLTPDALIERLQAGKVYPAGARAGRAQRLLPRREPRGAARGRAAPGGRGRRGQAASRSTSSPRARTA